MRIYKIILVSCQNRNGKVWIYVAELLFQVEKWKLELEQTYLTPLLRNIEWLSIFCQIKPRCQSATQVWLRFPVFPHRPHYNLCSCSSVSPLKLHLSPHPTGTTYQAFCDLSHSFSISYDTICDVFVRLLVCCLWSLLIHQEGPTQCFIQQNCQPQYLKAICSALLCQGPAFVLLLCLPHSCATATAPPPSFLIDEYVIKIFCLCSGSHIHFGGGMINSWSKPFPANPFLKLSFLPYALSFTCGVLLLS